MTSVRSGDSVGRSDIASRWPWPLPRGDFDQRVLVDDRRAAQQRPGDRDLVLARELTDQAARRVGEERQPFGQIGPRSEFGMWNETDQNAVKQTRHDRAGNSPPPAGYSSAIRRAASARRLGIAISDDLIEPGDQRCGDSHPNTLKTRRIGGFSGTLGRLGEGRVRLKAAERPQNHGLAASRALPYRGKPLYQPQLMVLIRSRIESGPLRDPLFLLPDRAWRGVRRLGSIRAAPAGPRLRRRLTHCKLDQI